MFPPAVSTTSTAPALPAGVTTTTVVEFLLEIVAAELPKVTEEVEFKFVPDIVTDVPPAVEPAFLVIDVMVGFTLTEIANDRWTRVAAL